MLPKQSYQELTHLDISKNPVENDCIVTLYKMLKDRYFSLEQLDLSETDIGETGLNLLLKAKTSNGGHKLTKGLIANKMKE